MVDLEQLPGPGRDLDAVICENVFGWRRMSGPPTDYDGPLDGQIPDILIPPTVSKQQALREMPYRGKVPFVFFVSRFNRYSTEIGCAWTVVENLRTRGWLVTVKEMPEGYPFVMGNDAATDPKVHRRSVCELMWMPTKTNRDMRRRLYLRPVGVAGTTPHAICLAALQAVEEVA